MKKILLISHAMELGGVEKSLLGLFEAIDYSEYEIDLFLYRHEGELLSHIPKQVNLLKEEPAYAVLGKSLKRTLLEGHFLLAAARIYAKLVAAWYAKRHKHKASRVALEYSHKFTKRLLPVIQPDTEYDLAISFLTPHYIAIEKVCAKKTAGWIHTDYTKIDINQSSEQKMWGKLDHIVSISDAVTEAFCKVFPTLEKKIVVIENILPSNLIKQQAKENRVKLESESINLLSVGRFCHAKNFDNVPVITKALRTAGLNIRWYLIGYGSDETLIRKRIAEANMEKYVIILGKQDNPYPYINACDIYVQPSRFEGKCVAVREAQMLCKPVIITNYDTAKSQLEDGVDGVIVSLTIPDCANGITAVLKDPLLQQRLIAACKQRDYSNADEIRKLYAMM